MLLKLGFLEVRSCLLFVDDLLLDVALLGQHLLGLVGHEAHFFHVGLLVGFFEFFFDLFEAFVRFLIELDISANRMTPTRIAELSRCIAENKQL